MRRRFVSGLVVTALAAMSAAGCSDEPPTTPITPTPTTVVETFSGTLTVNGAVTFPFTASTAGVLTGTVKSVSPPEAPSTIGFALGASSGATCDIRLANDNASTGSIVTGVVNAAGLLCARVYDVGKITGPVTFTIEIAHF